MDRVCIVVGARPQLIKLAALTPALAGRVEQVVVHTGQHRDRAMSGGLMEELGLPRPDLCLGISGGGHGEMTGRMLAALEPALKELRPALVLTVGDTNSTLAGALAAVKLGIPVCHVEAGCRTGDLASPEEVNRAVTDRVSALNLCPTRRCAAALEREGLGPTARLVGDVMYDLYLRCAARVRPPRTLPRLGGGQARVPASYYLLTCHRQENTGPDGRLEAVLETMARLDAPTLFPVHPRVRDRVQALLARQPLPGLTALEPVGYLDSLALVQGARRVVTDSGGLQREAFFACRPCVTLLDRAPWPETLRFGCNRLARPEGEDILDKLARPARFRPDYRPFGRGDSARRIAERVVEFLA